MGLFGGNQNPELKATTDKINDYLGKIRCSGEPMDIISTFTKDTYLWAEARKRMIQEADSGILTADKVENRYCELVAELTNTPKNKVFERRSELRGEDIPHNEDIDSEDSQEIDSEDETPEDDKIYVMDGNTLETGKNFLGKKKDEYVRCKCILDDDNILIEKRSTFTAKPKGIEKIYYKDITDIEFIPDKISTIKIKTKDSETLIQQFSEEILKSFYNGLKEYVDN